MPKPLRLLSRHWLFVFCILFNHHLFSQDNASEMLHLHTDKERYLPGDTIWFKCYIMQDGLPLSSSSTLYATLYNGNSPYGGIISIPLLDGMGDGNFVLPESDLFGIYSIVASTNAMLNQKDSETYTKRLQVSSGKRSAQNMTGVAEMLHFYPEGGSIINEVPNTVAIKLTDSLGLPFEATSYLMNNKSELLDSFKTQHDGMAKLVITPSKGVSYYILWKNNGGVPQKTILPVAEDVGIALHMEQVNDMLYYIVQNPKPDATLETLHVEAAIQKETVYKATLKMADITVLAGKIPLQNLPDGILQLTIYNNTNKPCAERSAFISQKKTKNLAKVDIIQKGLSIRAKNEIELSIADTLMTQLSLSIFDASFATGQNDASIYSDLLLGNNMRGYVHQPGWYFEDTSIARKQALDLLMQTNDWRKYKQQTPADGNVSTDNYLEVRGTITDKKGKLLANEPITMIVSQADSSKSWYQLKTNESGTFAQNGLIFFDSASIFLKLKDAENRKVTFSAPFTPSFAKLTNYRLIDNIPASNAGVQNVIDSLVIAGRKRNSDVTLQDVTVRGYKWRNDKMLKMDQKYTTGLFRGGANSYAFDVMNDPLSDSKFDIYNYIQSKGIPGVEVKYNGTEKVFGGRKGVSLFFLNETEVTKGQIENVLLSAIAYIKYIEMYPGYPGFPSALSVYLRKEDDLNSNLKYVEGNLISNRVAGYTPLNGFYATDYATDSTNGTADVRTTLYWEPNITLDKTRQSIKIQFYNNDISKRLKLVLEGINEEGTIIRLEKIIE
ncbi:MAG: hypothetical protein V4717_07585 [Bacteroidota bacterium]